MVIRQGDVYWVDLGEPVGSEPGLRQPHVVVQNDLFNSTRTHTVVVCVITSNLKWAEAPGNVLLLAGEAHLPKRSVVNVSQLYTIDKSLLQERLGTLSPERVRQIVDGLKLVLEPRG